MSQSKEHLLQQKYQNITLNLKEQTNQIHKNFNKIATLEPYMADIEKKHKIKNKLNRNNKSKLNQSSSRSFRIKDVSTSSLHKLNFDNIKPNKLQRNKQTINATGLLTNPKKIQPSTNNQPFVRERKAKSQNNRPFQSSFSKTINTREIINLTTINAQKEPKQSRQLKIYPRQSTQKEKSNNINAFNDYFLRNNKNKDSKPQKFRKNMYEIVLPKKNSITSTSKDNNSISIKKISYTQFNIDKTSIKKDSQEDIDLLNAKKTDIVRKNNFRRGKYQMAMHSSVNQNTQPTEQHSQDPLHSQRIHNHLENQSKLNKKDSTLSINQEMDILAQKEMIKFYQKVRTKQIQKSLQKSTEKYFRNDSYRPIKSKNEIQIYVSSIINPSMHKTSQSTYDKQSRNKSPIDMKQKTDFYAYDFDFEVDKNQNNNLQHRINEVMENSQQYEESYGQLNNLDFQNQRRQAEIQYFKKQNPNIQWSDQDCQADDI